jgi:predicted acyl esterase
MMENILNRLRSFFRFSTNIFLFAAMLIGMSTSSLAAADAPMLAIKTVSIPMKDGTLLPTDLYLPHENAENLPCILLRSPAGRSCASIKPFIPLATQGYVVAVQETRNVQDTEGKTMPYIADTWLNDQDGHETLKWLAANPVTNGKIGTIGFSAMGITQLLMAPYAPESLKAQFIGNAPASLYHHAIFPSGVLLKNQVEGWLGYYAKDSGVCSFVSNQGLNDKFWQRFDTRPVADNIKVPAIHQTGWYDTFLQGSIEAFVSRQNDGGEGGRGTQKLVIGPWTHFWPMVESFGDFSMPVEGRQAPFHISPLPWFDFYLKGNANGIDRIPAVNYYVMGPLDGTPSKGNVWKSAENWPVPAEITSFYLTSSNTLSLTKDKQKEKVWDYQQDPKNPVPTIGGLNLFLQSGPIDQRPIESRDDVIVFTGDPLKEDLEITGPIIAKLFMSPMLPGRTMVVRLCDVYPDGKSILVCDGIYRHDSLWSEANKKAVKGPQEVDVDLWATSMVFAKGHRIRISVSGSNFPRYDEAIKTISTAVVNQLHTGGAYPSRILLPIVK